MLTEPFIRRESARLVAALTRLFGVHNLALAEDVAQDALARALVAWQAHGEPESPAAWLMTTAKHRALDIVRRERTARTFAPELGRLLDSEWTLAPLVDEAFDSHVIRDEQLRMMFSCCHPSLSREAQLALILNILCGFGANEIAHAFLSGRAAMEKRISRGKQTLAEAKRLFDLNDADFATRLSTVRQALYLLFNEGYHGASELTVQSELCREALRLCALLLEHPSAATPTTLALASLMCLSAARLPTRLDHAGDLSTWHDQDRSLWDGALIAQGLDLLQRSASGNELSAFHVEAAIAATHASAPRLADTDWARIVELYDRLLVLNPSPVVELNRAIAIGERDGARAGLAALATVSEPERMSRYPFFPAARAELELRAGRREAAHQHFRVALGVARNDAERRCLEKRLHCALD